MKTIHRHIWMAAMDRLCAAAVQEVDFSNRLQI